MNADAVGKASDCGHRTADSGQHWRYLLHTLCSVAREEEKESERETLRGPETLHKLGLSLANLCLMSVPRNEVVSQANIIPCLGGSDSVASSPELVIYDLIFL